MSRSFKCVIFTFPFFLENPLCPSPQLISTYFELISTPFQIPFILQLYYYQMKLIILVASALVNFVVSQSVGNLPQCAIPCVTKSIAATGCQAVDVHSVLHLR